MAIADGAGRSRALAGRIDIIRHVGLGRLSGKSPKRRDHAPGRALELLIDLRSKNFCLGSWPHERFVLFEYVIYPIMYYPHVSYLFRWLVLFNWLVLFDCLVVVGWRALFNWLDLSDWFVLFGWIVLFGSFVPILREQ
jgi:hypothetical protein